MHKRFGALHVMATCREGARGHVPPRNFHTYGTAVNLKDFLANCRLAVLTPNLWRRCFELTKPIHKK